MKKKRAVKDYVYLYIKGLSIGAADVVPGGISGGTIAFIVGVYEELLESIKSINLSSLKLLFSLKFKQFWSAINGNFFIFLLGGIVTSIFTLAKPMVSLVENYPIIMWAIFFGLVAASAYVVSKDTKWRPISSLYLILGLIAAYFITEQTPTTTPETWWFIMFSGAIAICAMILPGISGAFVLLLIGKYTFLMGAVAELKWDVILYFVIGAAVGLIAFSHVFSWLMKSYKPILIPVVTGFLIGSLNKLWPWKRIVSTYVDNQGVEQPAIEQNISPAAFEALSGTDPLIWQAIVAAIAGFLLIYAIEWINVRIRRKNR